MISNKTVVNYKVTNIIEINNFVIIHFSIQVHLNNSINLKFKIQKLQIEFQKYKRFQMKQLSITKDVNLINICNFSFDHF